MSLIEDLAAQIQRNCRISDARSWGFHSVCGLLLRLRDQYKWERGLQPWDRVETVEVLPWVGEREQEWESLEGAELEPIAVDGEAIDPFDADAVNGLVSPHGCYYGAGYGMGMKPLFVFGRLKERFTAAGADVYILDEELVRDLSPTPALNRGQVVIARREAMKWYLWERIEEAASKKDTSLAALALRREGVDLADLMERPAGHVEYLMELVERETAAAIHHEFGEIAEEKREERWRQFLGRPFGMKVEVLARSLKDVLADTGEGGRLAHIVAEESVTSLGFYAAFAEGLRRRLFPELGDAFLAFLDDGDWGKIAALRETAHRRLRDHVESLMATLEEGLTAEEAGRRADALEEAMLGS